MQRIEQISSDALQQQTLVLDDGSQVRIQIYFRPMQQGWFINELEYGDFLLQGMRITNMPNMLYQYMNQLPFGLACITDGLREPSQQEDFSSGAARLYLLSAQECQDYRSLLENGS